MTDYIQDPRDLALKLLRHRARQGVTQVELAEASGTTQSWLSETECGRDTGMVSLDALMRVAAALGLRLALVPFTAEDERAVEEILSLESVVVPHDEERDEVPVSVSQRTEAQ